jgi:pilus assembly protein CpaC
MQTPADNLQAPNDMNSVFMGQLNKVVKAKTGDAAPVASAAPYQAPIGYVIE